MIELVFNCAKISVSNLHLRRELQTLEQLSFACFKLLDSFFSKSHSEKLQYEVIPDNFQLKVLEIMLCKTAAKNISFFSI